MRKKLLYIMLGIIILGATLMFLVFRRGPEQALPDYDSMVRYDPY